MDRRKLSKAKSLHSNLTSILNNPSSYTSFRRINSVTSLSSQSSSSVTSRKRKTDEDYTSDDTGDENFQLPNKRPKSVLDFNINNVRKTRGNFQAPDDSDDSLHRRFTQKSDYEKKKEIETNKEINSQKRKSLESLTETSPSKTTKSPPKVTNSSPKKAANSSQPLQRALSANAKILSEKSKAASLTKITNASQPLQRTLSSNPKLPSENFKNASPNKTTNTSKSMQRTFNTTRRELTHMESDSSDEDLFNEEDSTKKQKEVAEVAQSVASTSSRLSLGSSPFKKPQLMKKTTNIANKNEELKKNEESSQKKKLTQTKILDKVNKSPRQVVNESDKITEAPEVFADFLCECGVTLSNDDEPHLISKDTPSIREKMTKILSANPAKIAEIINAWNTYIENDANLKKTLNYLSEESEEICTIKISLVRLLLQVPLLQTDLFESLTDKVTGVVLNYGSNNYATENYVFLILQQFRFLEHIQDPNALTRRIDELLEIGPEWFKKEFISYLPDIVTDCQHHAIAEILCRLMNEPQNTKLTNVILDSIGNLAISKDFMENLRLKALEKLRNFGDVTEVPAIVRFLTADVTSLEVGRKVLNAICDINMECVIEHAKEESDKNQVLTVNALKMSLLMSKKISDAAMLIITTKENEATVFHFIITLLMAYSRNVQSQKAKKSFQVLKQHIRNGYYRPTLLKKFYTEYKEPARELQDHALYCACSLLKLNDRTVGDFAIEWFRLLFISQSDKMFKQREIIEKLLVVMGYDNLAAKNALALLSKMMSKPEEVKYLQNHCHFIRLLLERVDKMSLEDIAVLNDLMHGLCAHSEVAHDILHDDLSILMQKQLASPDSVYRSRGVLSAIMAIKYNAKKEETRSIAIELFNQVMLTVEKCPKSKCLFYDQLGQIVAQNKDLDKEFLEYITTKFTDIFTNIYYTEIPENNDEYEAKYLLNEEEGGCVKLNDGLEGSVVPILFRVLQICTQKTSENGDLEEINALLGSSILIPSHLDDCDPKMLNYTFHCINWIREIISAFVTQTNRLLRQQVIQRLDNLMNLQVELFTQLNLSDTKYQPPPCYFNQHPIPAFVKVEKKVSRKKGKARNVNKTTDMSEDEAWNKGSEIYAKNPTYFRRLDTKVALLLDLQMELGPSQASCETVTVPQVCFIVNELLMMFQNEPSESFVRDLIYLLPKICSKLKDLIGEIRNKEQRCDKEAVKLLLTLITMIFSWKPFQTVKYNLLLRDGLRTLACMANESNNMLRSGTELVKESYNYFESEIDIATQISLAVAFVNICQTLMTHSSNFSKENKAKQANIAFSFLSLNWVQEKHSSSYYRNAVGSLLKNWIDNEPEPLDKLKDLVDKLSMEITDLKRSEDSLPSFPSISKCNFTLLYKKILEGVVKGITMIKNEDSDTVKIKKWKIIMAVLSKMIGICKSIQTRQNTFLFVRYSHSALKSFLIKGMPILEYNLKYQTEDVRYIVKLVQDCTKYMHLICSTGVQKKDVAITKLMPLVKQSCEQFVFRIKGMCVLNNSTKAFWMGNLQNKNLEGESMASQTSETDSTSMEENESRTEDGVDDDQLDDEESTNLDVDEEEELLDEDESVQDDDEDN